MKYFCFLSFFFLFSCNDYTPKPLGYQRIDREPMDYIEFKQTQFSILYPSIAQITEVPTKDKAEYWFNISYPRYHAIIYCSYLPISKKNLHTALDDSYRLAYSHTSKADAISITQYSDTLNHVFSTVYDINGAVATPIQFYATDSLKHFVRGSLYFDRVMNTDSVAPIINFLRSDIIHLIQSLKWADS